MTIITLDYDYYQLGARNIAFFLSLIYSLNIIISPGYENGMFHNFHRLVYYFCMQEINK